MVIRSTEPGGDMTRQKLDRIMTDTDSGSSLVGRDKKNHEKAWYAKYLLRFGNSLRVNRRAERELTVTHSAPVISSASRRSVVSAINASETGSLGGALPSRHETDQHEAFVARDPNGFQESAAASETLLMNINGRIKSRGKTDSDSSAVTVTATASRSKINKSKRGKTKLERRKALRQILKNAGEYIDGVKKCNEILLALPPLPPLLPLPPLPPLPFKSEYVEKWLTDSSSDFTPSDPDQLACSEMARPDEKSSTQVSSRSTTLKSEDTSDGGTTHTKAENGKTKKTHKKTKKRRNEPLRGLSMGTICPVHSCTCTVNKDQPNAHSSACPSNTVNNVAGTLKERLFHVIPSSLSLVTKTEEAENVKFEPSIAPFTSLSGMDFFDPLPRTDMSVATPGHLLDDFEFSISLEDPPSVSSVPIERLESPLAILSIPAVEPLATVKATPISVLQKDEMIPTVLTADCSPECIMDRTSNPGRGLFYFGFRLNSRVRRKLSSYIFKRKPLHYAKLSRRASRISVEAQTAPEEVPAASESATEVPIEIAQSVALQGLDKQGIEKPDPLLAAVVSQNKELVASIANIFATLQSHVQRADDDRRYMTTFMQGSINEVAAVRKTRDTACSPAESQSQLSVPVRPSRSKKRLLEHLSQTKIMSDRADRLTVSPSVETKLLSDRADRLTVSPSVEAAFHSFPSEQREPIEHTKNAELPKVHPRKSLSRPSEASTPATVCQQRQTPRTFTLSLSGSKSEQIRLSNSKEVFACDKEEEDVKYSTVMQSCVESHVAKHAVSSHDEPDGAPEDPEVVSETSTKTAKSSTTGLVLSSSAVNTVEHSCDAEELSSDNSAVYGTARTDFAQSILSLNTKKLRKSSSHVDYASSTTPADMQTRDVGRSTSKVDAKTDRGKVKRRPKPADGHAPSERSTESLFLSPGVLDSGDSDTTDSGLKTAGLATPSPRCQSQKEKSPFIKQAASADDAEHGFYISSSSSGMTSAVQSVKSEKHQKPAERLKLDPPAAANFRLEASCQTSGSHLSAVGREEVRLDPTVLVTGSPPSEAATKPTAATRSTIGRSNTSQKHDSDTIKTLLGTDAFRVNISDSTIVDSETGMTFHPARSNSQTGNEDAALMEAPSKLNVVCDAERMFEAELQERLHDLQVENGAPTPLIELLEYVFYLLGLRGIQPEEDLFLPSCHVEDSMILWNAWKSKVFTSSGHSGQEAAELSENSPDSIRMFAFHSINRLFHFLSTYCTVPNWEFTSVSRAVLETNGDIKALYELFHSGTLEIPADRPKFFTTSAVNNRKNLRLFIMNTFRSDTDGRLESIQRQKCLFYVHLFKNDAITRPTADQIAEYRGLLRSFEMEELLAFNRTDEIFIDVTVQQWMSTHDAHLEDSAADAEFQLLREETKRWLSQTTLINSRNRYGPLGGLKMMAAKYLKGVLGNMSHEHRTFVSSILQIEQDPKTLAWTPADNFLDQVEANGLDKAVRDYIVPYRFVGGFNLPHQKTAVSRKEEERQETFNILEEICVQESISNNRLAQQAPASPKADLKALSRTQFYKQQLKDPDIRKHLLAKGQPLTWDKGQSHLLAKGQSHLLAKGQSLTLAKGQSLTLDKGQSLPPFGNGGAARRTGAGIGVNHTEMYEKVERYLRNSHAHQDVKSDQPSNVQTTAGDQRRRTERAQTESSVATSSDGSLSVSLAVNSNGRRGVQAASQPQLPVREQRVPASSINLSQYQRDYRQSRQYKREYTPRTGEQQPISTIPARLRLVEDAASYRLPVVKTDFLSPNSKVQQ
ncbi:hypothetical protein BV898_11852 [Hypsibius exemplaris]|uniref:Uncharacterized protein n=1 Tax=Hypsibius exemplaris TaxID=2072580 RepID=A0A1W0WFJ6_HYPEX|nr:hypothetical protein BV898_11852 [Hypsibius exemplaris]